MRLLYGVESMNVAIIANYWNGSQGGGIKTYLVNFVDELKKMYVGVDVIFGEGYDPENYRCGGNRFLFPLNAFAILRKIKPSIIHSQGTWYCLLSGVIYKELHRITLIHTFHTEPNKKLPLFFKMVFQGLLNKCDCVTFVSGGLEKRMEEVWGLKFRKTAITYAGVTSKKVSEKEIKEFCETYNIKNDSVVLLAHGLTAIRCKAEGAKLLIKAVRKLRNKYPSIILILTREGLCSNELKEFAESEGIYENVVFTGDVDNPYVPLMLCDLYTHISLGEGLPLALLEAMVMGKPIIATSVGGIPEAIEDRKDGILVEPYAGKIADEIEYLFENEELSTKLGEHAKKTAEEKFTWEKSANKFIEIYGL